ncbi:MAG: tetratricopeptide repeat-containing sulfotransferase family protein [Rhodanobacter sp.]
MEAVNISATTVHLRRQVREYVDTQQWVAAQTTLETLVQRVPHDVSARMELASVMLRRGQMRAATRQLLQAVPLLPNDAPLIAQLAWRLSIIGETVVARACVEHLDRAPNPPAQVLAEQAQLRWMLGEIPAARARMDRAVAAGIDTRADYYLNAMLFQFSGQIDEAEAVLRDCLQRWPDYGDAAVVLANLRKHTPAANQLDFLHELLGRLPESPADARASFVRAEFESAVFKVLDDLGRHDEAWSSLARSNARMRDLNPYAAAAEVALTEALIGASASSSVSAFHSGSAPECEGPVPIFIIGMPRSGTTLLDHMLSAHSHVVSAGEINDFQRQLHWMADIAPTGVEGLMRAVAHVPDLDFPELGARYLRQTQWRAQGRRYYIDKLPGNVRMVPFIRRALPHAPILHMVREPMDVCFSNLKAMFGNTSAYCYDMQALAHYHGQYERLTNHWRTAVPDGMFDVSYTALVSDPEATLRGVLGHCGLDMEEACLHPERNAAAVATPSSIQVRESIHIRSVGQWQHYARQLEPLRRAID